MFQNERRFLKQSGWLAVFITLSFSTEIAANDTAFGGEGSLPIPVSQPDIKMVNEVILIKGKNLNNSEMNGSWHYSCDFKFKNTLDNELNVSMGFPFPVYNEESANVALPEGQKTSHGKALVYDFQVLVDGKTVSSHKEKIAPNRDKGLYYDEAYLWDTTFPALATVNIHHDYFTGATFDVMGYHWVAYVLKTGALWHDKTIGHTQLEVIPNTPTRLCSEIDGAADYLKTTPEGMRVEGSGSNRKYVWDLAQFHPTEDMSLCLFTPKNYIRYKMIYPVINSENPLKDLSRLSSSELRILRNTVLAQYGRQFNAPDLHNYFSKQWWYEPNSAYSDSMLTAEDKKILALINKVKQS
ncbi:YARHG domain-containing protein [uncultured Legionella sp.]|uniref:YARHG domain-containing protein n=1 Tax=uncultured Legionella sp. TaxID=210934 RepID=UPI0026116002|nr:YARHG domain-containing protein [uncultured Legionella sp.]